MPRRRPEPHGDTAPGELGTDACEGASQAWTWERASDSWTSSSELRAEGRGAGRGGGSWLFGAEASEGERALEELWAGVQRLDGWGRQDRWWASGCVQGSGPA